MPLTRRALGAMVSKRAERRSQPPLSRRQARQASRERAIAPRKWLFVAGGTLAFAALAFLFLRAGDVPSGTATTPALPYAAPVRGDPTAPVTIVEYGDFQCPSCGAFSRSIEPQIVEQYVKAGKAKIVFKHFPWIGPESKRAAEAASCAGEQGRFWEYHDLLYANQRGENSGFLSTDRLKRFASDLTLDRDAFDRCLDGGAYRAAVQADFDEVLRLGLSATPSFVVNGQRVSPASFAAWQALIEAKLRG